MIEEGRIFVFLASLNPELDQVRVQVLGKEPFPSLIEVFTYVCAKESCQIVMLEKPSVENLAFAIPNPIINLQLRSKKKGDRLQRIQSGVIFVTNLDTREIYWKLHGIPVPLGKMVGKERSLTKNNWGIH